MDSPEEQRGQMREHQGRSREELGSEAVGQGSRAASLCGLCPWGLSSENGGDSASWTWCRAQSTRQLPHSSYSAGVSSPFPRSPFVIAVHLENAHCVEEGWWECMGETVLTNQKSVCVCRAA